MLSKALKPEYMQFIKCKANELTMLRKPMDHEDVIERVLDGLDDDYKPIIEVINGHDIPIAFEELHKKLISRELVLHRAPASNLSFPASANMAQTHSTYSPKGKPDATPHSNWQPNHGASPQRGPRQPPHP